MASATAVLRLFGDLDDIAGRRSSDGCYEVDVLGQRSVKDAVESLGVPHTEVAALLVDGRAIDFGRLLRGGEQVSVYPPFGPLDGASIASLQPAPPQPIAFVADVHLGRLAGWLRLLGFDTRYDNDADDVTLAAAARDEGRVLLTRDRGLLMRNTVAHGALIRSDDPRTQLRGVVDRFDLAEVADPFTRCSRCNGLLVEVAKTQIEHRLLPGTRRDHEVFRRCTSCDHLYWRGSHFDHLLEVIDEAVARR